jgi:predicted glycosyltransferase
MGTSLSICHVARLTKARAIVFFEDDVDVIRQYYRLGYVFADAICTPDCVRHKARTNHYTYLGYHELAYLHPNYFTPDIGIFREIGLRREEPYFLIRLVALRAVHDTGQKGLSLEACRALIHALADKGRVFLNAEMDLPSDLEPYRIQVAPERIHDVLAYATLFIGDSQTMTAEAAVLGTPALRCNTFVGRISYLEELEHRYGLTYGFLPEQYNHVVDKARRLLKCENLSQEWQRKRRTMLSEKVDVTAWIARFVESYMQSCGVGSG